MHTVQDPTDTTATPAGWRVYRQRVGGRRPTLIGTATTEAARDALLHGVPRAVAEPITTGHDEEWPR